MFLWPFGKVFLGGICSLTVTVVTVLIALCCTGGPLTDQGDFNPGLQYRCIGGKIWNTLLATSVQLCDHNEGDGGFAVVTT